MEVLVAFDAELFAHGGEDFGLFDGVDAEVGFEVEVDVQQLRWVAGHLRDDPHDLRGQGVGGRGAGRGRCFRRGGHRNGRGRSLRDGGSGWGRRRGASVDDPQSTVVHLEDGAGPTGGVSQPALPGGLVHDAVGVSELAGCAPTAVGHRGPAQKGHRDLRAEARGQTQCIIHRVGAADGQIQGAELGVGLLVIGHRRDDPGLQRLDRHDVLDAGAHRVAGESLGVGDHDGTRSVAEHPAQGVDLRCRGAATSRSVGLVGDEHRLGGDLCTVDPAGLRGGDQALHDLADVVHVEAGAVEGAVRGDGREHLADRL